jgi:hypothetical protein
MIISQVEAGHLCDLGCDARFDRTQSSRVAHMGQVNAQARTSREQEPSSRN